MKREKLQKIGRRFAILLCSMSLLTGCTNDGTVPQTAEQEEMAELSDEILQIRVGDVIGNGVIWEKDDETMTVVTAGHLFEMGNGDAEITFLDGLTVSVTDYGITKPDLAFVVVHREQISEERWNSYGAVTVDTLNADTKDAEMSAMVVLKAFDTEGELQLLEGTVVSNWIYVEDFSSHMILAQVDAAQGMSGGGLFDCEGQFLGIMCGVSEDGEIAVVPLTVIQAQSVTISENF